MSLALRLVAVRVTRDMNLSSRDGCAPGGNRGSICTEDTGFLGGASDSSGGTSLFRPSYAREDMLAPAPDSFVADTTGRKPLNHLATPGWRVRLRSYVRQYDSPITATSSARAWKCRHTQLATERLQLPEASRGWGIHTRGEPAVALTHAHQMGGI